MSRRKILFISLTALILAGGWILLDTRWGLVLGIRLASAVAPGQINVKSAEGSLLGPIHLRDVQFQNGKLKLDIHQLDLTWALSRMLVGKLQVQNLQASGVQLALPPKRSSSTKTQLHTPALLPAIELQHAQINDIQVQPAAASAVIIQSVTLAASLRKERLEVKQFDVRAYQGQASASGTATLTQNLPLSLAIEFRYQPGKGNPVSGHGRVQGDMEKLQLTQQLSGAINGTLQAHAQDVLASLAWRATLSLKQLELDRLRHGLPAVAVTGKVQASGNRRAFSTESTLQLNNKNIGKAQLHLQTDSDLALTQYRVRTQGNFNSATWPAARFSLQAKGGRDGIAISQLDVQTLKGEVKGQARLDWRKVFSVNGQLDLHDLDTGQLAVDWPGRLSARLVLDSRYVGAKTPVHFSLQQIRGQLRGHPVTGQVDGQWSPQSLVLKTMNLDVAGTKLTAQGQLARTWDLQFQANSDRLDRLLPAVRGKLDVHGVLSGSVGSPRLRLEGEAQQLAYGKRQVSKLHLKMDMGLAARARSFLALQADDVRVGGAHWDQVQLQVDGTNAAQTLELQAQGQQARLLAALHGRFQPWRWQGELDRFELDEIDYGRWQLQQPVRLILAKGQYSLSSFCLGQDAAHLCLQGSWSASHRQASLDVSAMPLHLLRPWLPPDIRIDGIVNAHARLDTTAKGALHGEFAMNVPDKSVVVHFVKLNEALALGASHLTATLDDKGLQAALHVPLSRGGGIDSQLRLPGWSPVHGLPRTQSVVADLKLDNLPADVVTRLIPKTAQARGQFAADLQVNGTVGEPRLRGKASWQGGSVLVPPLGINIHDVSAELSSAQPNTIKFTVKAKSGEGALQLAGQTELDPKRGWPTRASLTSQRLEVSNIPEAHILMDSNLAIQLQGTTINVSGDITVPWARLRPRELPMGAVPVSPDVVIVNAGKQTSLASRWQLTAHLRVQLGDEVDFKGFGISGNLRGNLALNDEPGKLILGQGEVSIANGTYRLRGQDLTIRRGRLIFSNTFIDDPALDVEAVREVNTVTAGVRLKGTLKQPQLTVFSEPVMSQSDALAYLLLGHSLNQSTQAEGQSVSNAASALGLVAGNYLAKGIGGSLGLDELRVDVNQTTQSTSLVLGKYLSPKLYLRYYNGIAESSRILQLQYQLSRRVQIQTESGYRGTQSVTGGDIFFTIEY